MVTVRARSVLLTFTVLLQVSLAQFGPDSRWLTPNGSRTDFSSSFSAGDTVTLSWKALNESKSDLWLTHWDVTTYPWHYQVAANVDISNAGTLKWNIDIPASTIQNDNHFVLRFYPLNAPYAVLQIPQNDSPGFIVTGGATSSAAQGSSSSVQSTKSTSASSASSASTKVSSSASLVTSTRTTTNAAGSTIAATVTTSIPTSTEISGSSQTTSASSSSGLSVASQAGIGVGAGLFIIVLFVAGCFFGRRFGTGRTYRRDEQGLEREGFPMHQNKSAPYSDANHAELEGTTTKAQTSDKRDNSTLLSSTASYRDRQSETPWAEMTGSSGQPIEKSGSMIRPGVHELG